MAPWALSRLAAAVCAASCAAGASAARLPSAAGGGGGGGGVATSPPQPLAHVAPADPTSTSWVVHGEIHGFSGIATLAPDISSPKAALLESAALWKLSFLTGQMLHLLPVEVFDGELLPATFAVLEYDPSGRPSWHGDILVRIYATGGLSCHWVFASRVPNVPGADVITASMMPLDPDLIHLHREEFCGKFDAASNQALMNSALLDVSSNMTGQVSRWLSDYIKALDFLSKVPPL